ncbi:MAG: flagellar filament capping protein FliD [Kineothrix sp.]|nr:flagellar filament capping protein FliD [Kineothrix sp.]
MPIRITGMNSGLDTESIISELVKAQKTKVDSVRKKQTSLQWKQEAWKDLNAKIYKLFQNTLGNMRLATDYSKKITDVSHPSIAQVISSDDAMNATQELEVKELATTGYMTGAQVGDDVTKTTKLTDMGIAAGSTITVTTGGKSTDIAITEGMTVAEFVGNLKSAGVEANFDEKNKRFHIAASKSGKVNDFSITASNTEGTNALKQLGILSYDAQAKAQYEKYANMDQAAKDQAVNDDVAKRVKSYISQRENLLKTQTEQTTALNESKAAFSTEYGEDVESVDKDALKKSIDDLKAKIEADGDSATESDKEELAKLQGKMSAVENYEAQKDALDATTQSLNDVESYLDLTDSDNIKESSKLRLEVTGMWNDKILTAADAIANWDTQAGSDVQRQDGKNAKIVLNGVTYEGESNTFEVNGLTITALQKSDEKVTLTTRRDTDGVYNMIKNFLKEYNALINEMDKLYNAESSKGYEPLTDEEKKELSDSEIEKWEGKIKDSILRRDSNLSSISSAMKNIMMQGAVVNGKQMYLSNFGIETLGYFNASENERNAYHINGDEDDAAVSSKANDLKSAIAADPDTVIEFFSQLSQNLYTELNKQSSSVDGVRSFGSFYDDKRMQKEYDDYKDKIKKQEAKLTALEDKWYNKFAAMETALAKLQSNQSAVSSLLGGM